MFPPRRPPAHHQPPAQTHKSRLQRPLHPQAPLHRYLRLTPTHAPSPLGNRPAHQNRAGNYLSNDQRPRERGTGATLPSRAREVHPPLVPDLVLPPRIPGFRHRAREDPVAASCVSGAGGCCGDFHGGGGC